MAIHFITGFDIAKLKPNIFCSFLCKERPLARLRANSARYYKIPVGQDIDDEENDQDDDTEDRDLMNRVNARTELYGSEHTDQPGYIGYYTRQLDSRMKDVTVGGSWSPIGPTYTSYPNLDSGRVSNILPHPTARGTVYVLSSGGGLWKTTNFFDEQPMWRPLTDYLPTTSGGSAALGSNPDTIYLGLGDAHDNIGIGGIFTKSIDGGESWSIPIDLNSFVSGSGYAIRVIFNIQIHMNTDDNNDIILISTNNGLLRSDDGGISFVLVYSSNSSSCAVYSLIQSTIGWIAHDADSQSYVTSNDTGLTWNTPVGSNWDTITTGNAGRTTFAVGAPGEAIVYALVAKKSDNTQLDVLKSVDGGIIWISCDCNANYQPTTSIPHLLQDLNVLGTQGWYGQMLLVDPSDSTRNTVYVGGQLTSVRTTTGGGSWTIISTSYSPQYFDYYYGIEYVHADFHTAAYIPSTPTSTDVGSIVFGTDGGVFVSSNQGHSWSSNVNRNLVTHLSNYIAGSPLLGDRLMIGLQDLGTRERTSETETGTGTDAWSLTASGDGEGCGYSQAVNKVNIMSMYNNKFKCRYYDAKNGGFESMTYDCVAGIDDEEDDKPFYTNLCTPSATADPSGEIFFTMTYKNIYKSYFMYGMILWRKIGTIGQEGISPSPFRNSFHAMGIGPTSTNQLAFAKDTEICITTNGGTSWTTVTITSSISGWSKGTSPVWASSTVLYLASENPTIRATRFIKSTNTGSTWIAPNTGSTNTLPDIPVRKLTVSNTDTTGNTVIAATWIGVYITTDGGVNWNVLGSKLPNVIVSDMYQSSSSLFVSTYGRGVWQLPLSDVLSSVDTETPTPAPVVSTTNTSKPTPTLSPTPSLTPTSQLTMEPSTEIPIPEMSHEPSMEPSQVPTSFTSSTSTSSDGYFSMPSGASSPAPSLTPSYSPSTTRHPSFFPTRRPSKHLLIKAPSRRPSAKPVVKRTRTPSSSSSSSTHGVSSTRTSQAPSRRSSKKPSRVSKSPSSKKPTLQPSSATATALI
eukprot:gene10561-22039_t